MGCPLNGLWAMKLHSPLIPTLSLASTNAASTRTSPFVCSHNETKAGIEFVPNTASAIIALPWNGPSAACFLISEFAGLAAGLLILSRIPKSEAHVRTVPVHPR